MTWPDADPARGRDPAAAVEHDQEILDRPVAQRIGEDDVVADELVALGVTTTTLPLARTSPRLAVPDDLFGGEIIAVARHPHLAARGDDVGVAVVLTWSALNSTI